MKDYLNNKKLEDKELLILEQIYIELDKNSLKKFIKKMKERILTKSSKRER